MRQLSLAGASTAFIVALGVAFPKGADAACSGLPATAGADTIVCDGAAPDTTPFFNTGAGADSVTITGGTITADPDSNNDDDEVGPVSILQEDGADRMEVTGGSDTLARNNDSSVGWNRNKIRGRPFQDSFVARRQPQQEFLHSLESR